MLIRRAGINDEGLNSVTQAMADWLKQLKWFRLDFAG